MLGKLVLSNITNGGYKENENIRRKKCKVKIYIAQAQYLNTTFSQPVSYVVQYIRIWPMFMEIVISMAGKTEALYKGQKYNFCPNREVLLEGLRRLHCIFGPRPLNIGSNCH